MTKDEKYIRKCIQLAETALRNKEHPFGCLIVKDDEIIAESGDAKFTFNDISNHAELNAVRIAQRKIGSDLKGCELYANCEPCVMCSFAIREVRISKVVFGLPSKQMGGYSKWQVLQERKLETLLMHPFSPIPEVIPNILLSEAKATFDRIGWDAMFIE